MASSYTTDLRLNKQGNGDNNNTWGSVINTQLDLLDEAISGLTTVNCTTGSNQTLSTANGTSDEARKMILKLSGTLINAINVVVPTVSKVYVVDGTSLAGTFEVTVKTNSGTGVSFAAGQCGIVSCDGTNVIEIYKTASSAFQTGMIMMWSGTISTIPSGWVLCDGTNSTPNLTDKFVIGAKQDSSGVAKTNITGSLTQEGGSKDAVVIDHTHATTVTDPGHTHSVTPLRAALPRVGGGSGNVYDELSGTVTTGSSTTGITVSNSSTGVSGTNQNLPPYYALAFIMKT